MSIRLTNGDVVQGEIFCYDLQGSNTVILSELRYFVKVWLLINFVIEEQKDSDHASFRLIKVQHVREINAYGPPPIVGDNIYFVFIPATG